MGTCPQCNNPVSEEFTFCPECGQPLGSPAAQESIGPNWDRPILHVDPDPSTVTPDESVSSPVRAEEAQIPFRLQVRLPQRGRINDTISLPFRVTNVGPTPISALEFSVGATLQIQSHAAFEFQLHPGEVGESSVVLAATCPGEHEVLFTCSMPAGQEFVGRLPFTVKEPTESTQVINYTDARQIQGRVVVGTEGGRLETAGIQLNKESIPADYAEVLLRRPARVRHILTKQLHGVFRSTNCDRLSLEIPQTDTVLNLGLLATREISLGRNRDANDVVLRVAPIDEDRTAKISRQHARLRFESEGITWENLECRHGTLVGETALAKFESFRVFQGAVISPAGQLPLKFTIFPNDQSNSETVYERIARQVGIETSPGTIGPVSAARIERLDGLQLSESYIFMQGSLILGASPACQIPLNAASVSPLHAKLSWFGNSFWLEPLQDARLTLVDGQPVPMNHVAQLRQHMHIQLGETEIAVHPFRQCHL